MVLVGDVGLRRAIEALGLTDDELKLVLGGTLASVLGDRLPQH